MVLVVCLEDRGLVSGSSPNAIVLEHNISKLIKRLEYVNTNTSVEASGLQEPKILLIMAALRDLVRRPSRLLLGQLVLIEFLIDSLIVFFYITINNFHYAQEMVHSITNIIFQVVQHDRQRHNIINIKLLSFIILFHIQKQVILCRQLPMPFHMVHQLFESMFADKVIFDAA